MNNEIGTGIRFARSVLAAVVLACLPLAVGAAQSSVTTLSFVGHGAFFSQESHLNPAADPEVFIQDQSADEGQGPGGLAHAAGFRPAQLGDEAEAILYDAQGDSLEFTLGTWLGARGTAEISRQADGSVQVATTFEHLIAFGDYSLFLATPSQEGTTFTPLDGDGVTNTFTADGDGTGALTVDAPSRPPRNSAIVLVYHSDDVDHGTSRGTVGTDAHEQLIARIR